MPDATDIVHKTLYDGDGNVIATVEPGSNGADAGTTDTIYYTAGTNSIDDADCGSQPAWAGQVCLVTPAAQPESGSLVTTPIASTLTKGYDYWLDPTVIVKSSGQATQTTTYSYMLSDGRTELSDGRLDTTTETTTNLPGSTPVPTTKVLYDPTTLEQVGLASLDSNGTITSSVKSTLDLWGRITRYVDANGTATDTNYVPGGTAGAGEVRTVTSTPGSASMTSTYTYDGTDSNGATEHRGLPTQLVVDGLGTYQATYDVDANLSTESMPGSITETRTYDSLNRATGISYSSLAGQIVSYTRQFNGAGQVDDQSDTYGRSASFGYDNAGRLTSVIDSFQGATTGSTSCSTRSYGFDSRGDRTSLTAATAPSCTTSGSTTTTWAYDGYSRQATAADGNGSYVYDAFGRQTIIPAADAPSSAGTSLSLGYFDSDAVASISQGSSTTKFTIDPSGRRATESNGSTVLGNYYVDNSDNPAWSTTTTGSGTTVTRYISDLSGAFSATATSGSSSSTALELQDLAGNSAVTVPLAQGSAATGNISVLQFDEYGNPSSGSSGRYGWHGAAQRATTSYGLNLMGDRLYNPYTGRFSSIDPDAAGNENAYNYPNDPVDLSDISGDMEAPLEGAGGAAYAESPGENGSGESGGEDPGPMRGARAIRAGQAGEAKMRAVNADPGIRDTYRGRSGKLRISDGGHNESKNVRRQGYTSQIRDAVERANQRDTDLHLWINEYTRLSSRLQREMVERDDEAERSGRWAGRIIVHTLF